MNKKLQKQTEMIVELMSFHKIYCQTLSDCLKTIELDMSKIERIKIRIIKQRFTDCLMVIYKLNPSFIRQAIDTEITFLIELRNSIDPKDEFDCSTNSDEWS
jgi:hypothetical protein